MHTYLDRPTAHSRLQRAEGFVRAAFACPGALSVLGLSCLGPGEVMDDAEFIAPVQGGAEGIR
jgi:hypothetical protein